MEIDTSFDEKLGALISLKLLPWVGKNYTHHRRLLIVGESHYHFEDEDGNSKNYNIYNFTRSITHHCTHVKPSSRAPFYRPIEKIMTWDDQPSSEEKAQLWKSVAFSNVCQRILDNKTGRPVHDDYSKGWDTLLKIIDVLQPDYCLFMGVTAATYDQSDIRRRLAENNYTTKQFKYYDKISNIAPRSLKIVDGKGKTISLYFIRHPSRYFSWQKWAHFINDHFSDYQKELFS